jgi:nucleoside-diphosphate-sugar epimerase
MQASGEQTILMTGATGFLGMYMLRNLLDSGYRVVALVRPPLDRGRKRLIDLLGEIGCDAESREENERLLLVEGALPDDLPEERWGKTDTILNCAASLQLYANGNGDPYATNVEGTKAIIEWAREHFVGRIFAVSTAYTCGWDRGRILEDFHLRQPEFQTNYEHSKWTAEHLLRSWAEETDGTLTVFRPSFLVGDSRTGYTAQFAGFYQFGRLVSLLKEQFRDPNNGALTHVPLRIPGRPEDLQNLVPVDFAARVAVDVVERPEYHGRIYHLTNPKPPSNDMIRRFYEEYFGLTGGYFVDPQEVIGHCTPAESLLWDKFNILTPRMTHNPIFEMGNTLKVMEAAGRSFPMLDRECVFRLFEYAVNQDWGRQSVIKKK